jgi:hypothetical protein
VSVTTILNHRSCGRNHKLSKVDIMSYLSCCAAGKRCGIPDPTFHKNGSRFSFLAIFVLLEKSLNSEHGIFFRHYFFIQKHENAVKKIGVIFDNSIRFRYNSGIIPPIRSITLWPLQLIQQAVGSTEYDEI